MVCEFMGLAHPGLGDPWGFQAGVGGVRHWPGTAGRVQANEELFRVGPRMTARRHTRRCQRRRRIGERWLFGLVIRLLDGC